MRCQRTIHLQILNDDDSLNLFLMHAKSNEDSSSSDLEGVARDIVKECGRLPVAIVALASTLKNWPVCEWKVALTTLQNSRPLRDVDEDLTKVYKCLQLSYEKIGNRKAQKLFLLCSLFPEDYEIPISLFIRLGIGSRIFGEVDKYYVARGHVLAVKNKLTASSLLMKAEKECVKMHDLVREVALWIAEEDVQVIMDSITTLKANKRFLFWNIDDFADWIDSTRLEILFLWVNGQVPVRNPDALFARMTMLKVLFLLCKYEHKCLPPSLSQSLLSLENIRTVILNGWKLVDFSCLKYLRSLETLGLENCLMTELPKEIREIKKLRLLGLRKCEIERNNPFEVIWRCSQLEELCFVGNHNVEDWKLENGKENIDEVAYDISPTALQMNSIACSGYEYFEDDDNGLLKCFNSKHVKNLILEAMFKYLVGRAQVHELGGLGETGWKNVVPNIIPLEDGGMNDLVKLCLYEWGDIECLIDTKESNVIVFSKLAELHLDGVDVKQLYQGHMPSGFLRQLQILKLRNCKKLHNIFFDGNLRLPHLKVLELEDCPMFQPSIFELFVARSLGQLEELVIKDCKELKCLITDERLGEEIEVVDNQKGYGLLFPKLKSLQIKRCGKLELVSPLLLAGDLPLLKELYISDCRELKYIFSEYRDEGQVLHQEIMLPSLTEMILLGLPSFINIFKECKKCMQRSSPILKDDSKDKNATSRTCVFSWGLGCCFLPTATDTDFVVSDATWQEHTISQITQSIKETTEQGLEENCLTEDAMMAIRSTNWDSRKQSTGPFVNLFGKDSAQTINETRDSSVPVESKSEKPTKASLPHVIPFLHGQSLNGDAGPSSPTSEICEILQLVELKDSETALLAQALKRYPQLILPREHRTDRIIAWSYRVLVDILVMLATKTPYTITASEKSTLESNLSEATFLGLDKDWVESVRAKAFNVDMSDVLAAEEEIQVKQVELEAIENQLLGLLKECKKLVMKMAMLREIG